MKKEEPVLERTFFEVNTTAMEDKMWKFKRRIYTDFDARTEKVPSIYGKENIRVIQIHDKDFHIIGQLFNTKDSFTIKGTIFTKLWEEMFDDKVESNATSNNKDIDLIKDIIGAKFVKK